jgi:hypothetical protein
MISALPTQTVGISLAVLTFLGLLGFLFYALRDKEHIVYRVFIIMFVVFLAIILPKATIDDSNYCAIVTSNQTVEGNVTSYEYEKLCFTNENSTTQSFFTYVTRFIWFTVTYLLVYLIYKVFIHFDIPMKVISGFRRRRP